MSGVAHTPKFETIQITKLNSTFGAEIFGVDISQPIPDEVFQKIPAAVAKVRGSRLQPQNTSNISIRPPSKRMSIGSSPLVG